MKNLWELLRYCKCTTAGNISHCANDFWIFYCKTRTYCKFNTHTHTHTHTHTGIM